MARTMGGGRRKGSEPAEPLGAPASQLSDPVDQKVAASDSFASKMHGCTLFKCVFELV